MEIEDTSSTTIDGTATVTAITAGTETTIETAIAIATSR
jgi:hypothetical protein